jgi:glutaredoxin
MAEKVFIYTLSTCGHCKRAKQFLNEHGIPYEALDVDLCEGEERASTIDEVKKHNPKCTFPTILIGDQVIVGFREDDIKDALGIV